MKLSNVFKDQIAKVNAIKTQNMTTKAYIKYLETGVISRPFAMKVKCAECMGWYLDGRLDCTIKTCPNYYWMPYGELVKSRKGKPKDIEVTGDIEDIDE